MKKTQTTKAFEFTQFSIKQLQLMNWWHDNSPYCGCDMVIADGSIRSGNTKAGRYETLLFEELLDTPVTLAPGERFARNFEFRLEVA